MKTSESLSTTYIRADFELHKITAFLRAGVKHKRFEMAATLLASLLEELDAWAKAERVTIRLEILRVDLKEICLLGVGGAAVGIVAGLVISALIGGGVAVCAVSGGMLGAALFTGARCIRIERVFPDDGTSAAALVLTT